MAKRRRGPSAGSAEDGRLVYSTERGRLCPECAAPIAACRCTKRGLQLTPIAEVQSDGWVRLLQERKGRKGKGVTLVTGLSLPEPALAELAKALKSRCGVGGTAKAGVIELQTGDRETIKGLLEVRGFKVKLAGGAGTPQ